MLFVVTYTSSWCSQGPTHREAPGGAESSRMAGAAGSAALLALFLPCRLPARRRPALLPKSSTSAPSGRRSVFRPAPPARSTAPLAQHHRSLPSRLRNPPGRRRCDDAMFAVGSLYRGLWRRSGLRPISTWLSTITGGWPRRTPAVPWLTTRYWPWGNPLQGQGEPALAAIELRRVAESYPRETVPGKPPPF